MANTKPTAQTGALTLVLLVKFYRSQMIALLVKNGIVVNNNATDQKISTLMADLLKVSKSYFKDLNDFITNPKVIQRIAGGIQQTAQYSNMSGSYMKAEGEDGVDTNTDNLNQMQSDINDMTDNTGDPVIDTAPIETGTGTGTGTSTSSGGSFFSNLNIGDIIKGGLNLFGQYTKGQTDAEIARQHALVEQAKAEAIKAGNQTYTDPISGQKVNVKDTTMSTTTIVILSLVGVAVLGTVIYFATRPKSS